MESAAPLTVVLVEDDRRLATLTRDFLVRYELDVLVAHDGREGLELILRAHPDVVVLDLMLPGMDGMEIVRALRARSDVPVILLTARESEGDRVLGLESGADDYVTKPFSARELLARIRSQARRARGQAGPPLKTLAVGRIRIDAAARRVTMDGNDIVLTTYEFDLLRVLAERAGRPLAREQLMELARGNVDEVFDRSIDFHISRLRQKLGDDARQPQLIKTVRGVGYLLAGDAG